jgi:pantetheine-phosphate adenylyltransferase
MKFQRLIVGGTFDLLHDGHQMLLDRSFEMGEKIYLGITSDKFNKKLKNYDLRIKHFNERKSAVEKYLRLKNWLQRAEIVEINDRFGSTLTDANLLAIVVSPETFKTALEINQIRQSKEWKELEIIKVPWVLAKDNQPISSTRIRNGEIDRQGNLYSLSDDWGIRYLSEELRSEFKKPLGVLVSDLSYLSHLNKFQNIIAVGDVTVTNLLKLGITAQISIIDLKVKRRQKYKNVLDLGFSNENILKKVNNPAGTISYESIQTLSSLIKSQAKSAIMQVNGEDDLLTLLAMFLAPLGYLIVYGQPAFRKASDGKLNEGLVLIEVTQKTKNQARKYLDKFTLA